MFQTVQNAFDIRPKDYLVLEKDVVWFLNHYPSMHPYTHPFIQQTPTVDQTPH